MPSPQSDHMCGAGSASLDVESFLNQVEQVYFDHSNGPENADTNYANSRKPTDFLKLTRGVRTKLSWKMLKSGRILDALRLTIITDINLSGPGHIIRIAHLIKDMGHSDLALRCFVAAARMAQKAKRHKDQSDNAIFNLGHCAKIAGNYALACEAFAWVAMRGESGSSFAKASEHDLQSAITNLTGSFVIGEAAGA